MNQKREENCIFCKILEGEIPAHKVYEDDSFIAILDTQPAAEGHVIIISKNHAANIFELSDEDAGKVFLVAKKIASGIKKAYNPEGINILQNNGKVAGQSEFHLHVHVVPRFLNDQVKMTWEPISIDDYEAVAEKIRKEM